MDESKAATVPGGPDSAIPAAGLVIGRLAEVWDEWQAATGSEKRGNFIKDIFGRMWRDGDRGEDLEAEFDNWEEQPEETRPLALLQAALVACAYATQAMKAQQDGNPLAAWKYVASSRYWLGIVIGGWSIRKDQPLSLSEIGRQGANTRHAENREMKRQILCWYAENAARLGSKDAAAEEAVKIVPVKFRTIRDWLKGA